MRKFSHPTGGLVVQQGAEDVPTGGPIGAVIVSVDAGANSATVRFSSPTDDNEAFLANYKLQIFAADGTTLLQTLSDINASANSQSVNGLTAGTSYVASLEAVSTGGTSSASTMSFTTFTSANAPWDPTLPGPSDNTPGGIFDTIVGPLASVDLDTLQPFTVGMPWNSKTLAVQATIGPNSGSPLRTSIDTNGNAVISQASIDATFNLLQAANTTAGTPPWIASIVDSICQSCVQGDNAGVAIIRSVITPTVRASQVAGGGATSGSILAIQADINGITDGGDPSSLYYAIYTRYAAQKPTAIDGQPFNGIPAYNFQDPATGKYRNGTYYTSKVRTDVATVTSGSSAITDAAITLADSHSNYVPGPNPPTTAGPLSVIIGRMIQPVAGVIPVGAYVGAIQGLPATPVNASTGTGFTMVDWLGRPLNALGNASSITLMATPATRTDANGVGGVTVSATSTATSINDSAIKWYEKGRSVTLNSQGFAAGYVGDVVPGTSFTLVDSTGVPIETGVAVTQITLGQWEFATQVEDYVTNSFNYSDLSGTGASAAVGNTVKLYMADASSSTANHYVLECVAPGVVDPTATGSAQGQITGGCSQGYSTYGGVPNAGETGPFFYVINGTAINCTYTLNSDGTINTGSFNNTVGGVAQAVFTNLGGIPHADGVQMLSGDGLFFDHSTLQNIDACPYLVQPSVSGSTPVTNCHCRKSYVCGGSNKWFDIETHFGPLNFNPGSSASGIYVDPVDSIWKTYLPNKVLTDTTGIQVGVTKGAKVGDEYKTLMDGTRPRGIRWVENWMGPLNSSSAPYPQTLSDLISANSGGTVSSDAQWIKGIQNQYGNVFSTDGISTTSTLTAGSTYTTIPVSSGGVPHALQVYDPIFVVEPQDSNGQSNSRMFVVGPAAVAKNATSINVMTTEGFNPDGSVISIGTFPVINTIPEVTIPSGAAIYTPYSDIGAMLTGNMNWKNPIIFDWNNFDRNMAGTAALSKKIALNATTLPIDFLPSGGLGNLATATAYSPTVGDQIVVQSVTPDKTTSTTAPFSTPFSQTFTIAAGSTATSLKVNEPAAFAFEKQAIVTCSAYTPKWNGSAVALSQSTLNTRWTNQTSIGGNPTNGFLGMPSCDARVWPRQWGNLTQDPTTGNLVEIISPSKANTAGSYGPTSGNYTGYDAKGGYIGP